MSVKSKVNCETCEEIEISFVNRNIVYCHFQSNYVKAVKTLIHCVYLGYIKYSFSETKN